MATETPESGTENPQPQSSSIYQREISGIPVWVWMLGLLVAAGAYYLWKKNKAKTAAAQAQQQNTATGTQTAAQTPPFIIQNYTTTNTRPYTTTTPVGTPITTALPPTPTSTGTPPPTTTATPPPTPTSSPTPVSAPAPAQPIAYQVKPGDTLSGIASKYGTSVSSIWAYNTGTGPGTANRPASTIQTLLSRGPNLLFSGETIYIPPTS